MVGKSRTCRGCCGKVRRASKKTSLSKLGGVTEWTLLFLYGPHGPAETQGLTENSRRLDLPNVSSVTPPSMSLSTPASLNPDVLPGSGCPGWKDTRNERSLLPLAGWQGVPGLCAASGVQFVIPPLCAPKARVRIKVLTLPGHPALAAVSLTGAGPALPPPLPPRAVESTPGAGGVEAEALPDGMVVRAWGRGPCTFVSPVSSSV